MIVAFLIGRLIFALYWLESAYTHLAHADGMTGYAASKGLASPKAAVVWSGILLLAGGLSILLGWYPAVGVGLLVIFLLGVSFKMHAYWSVADPMAKNGERIAFMKNMALLGALLMLLAIPEPWSFSIGNWGF